ncbi:DUF4229 domain-containing protein [Aeromicrobium sp. IC_218]|uniref:DUF4229 domain-containing protein n=1 Tax=Aeromicrobium sp. IC_218 TaxID=2545468 RepID=UPI00103BE72C|nr:DUF4229 domain-containing protein [Aeromicrobium sp. IC_218]TCJ00844.1 DUF4229 domain-containing protein [Aeromicrobium sp. IC_218]
MSAFWKYTLARLGLFVACFAVFFVVLSLFFKTDETLVLLAALGGLLTSALLSFFVLRGLRDDLARQVSDRAANMSRRIEESRRAEDVD